MIFLDTDAIPRIGFLGEIEGLTNSQKSKISGILEKFHPQHSIIIVNDEVGGCQEFKDLAEEYDFKTYLYPYTNNPVSALMEECKDCIMVAKTVDKHTAKKNIVEDSDVLIISPVTDHKNDDEIWKYLRYAIKKKIETFVIYPYDDVEYFEA